jgi:protein-S-isoprenylcysteine O-methyltransferase Ste14
MYVANLLTLTGLGIFFRSWRVLVWTAIAAVAFHLFVVIYEEPSLARRFGASYEDYRRAMPRWWPRPPRPASAGAC